MFEELLIVIFLWLVKICFILFSRCFFIFFFFILFFFSLKQLLKQLSHFFSTITTFCLKIRFFSFCHFIFFLFFVFVIQNLIRKLLIFVFILKNFILKQFYRFFFAFCRCLVVWNFLSFNVFFLFSNSMILIKNIRVWCSFMLSFSRKKNLTITFFLSFANVVML